MDVCNVSCMFASSSADWSVLFCPRRRFWPELPHPSRYRSHGPRLTWKWMDAMFLACLHRARLSGASSFTLVADSGPSFLILQDIDRMACNSPGNGCMQYILHVSVELGCLESPASPLSSILARASSALKISIAWLTTHLEMDICDVSCMFPSSSGVWSRLLHHCRQFWPELPQLSKHWSHGPRLTCEWIDAIYYV